MRGRTNITQRSGTVPVNGDVEEFIVADGKNINVGDFVSVIYGNASYYDGLDDSYNISYGSDMFEISNNKLVAFYGQNICVFNTSINGGIEVDKILSGTFHSVGGVSDYSKVYKIDNSHFAIAYYSSLSGNVSSTLNIDIITLDIENNTVTFETKQYSLNFSSSLIPKHLMGIICNGVIFIPYIGKEGTSYYRNLTIAWFDINLGDCGVCAITDYYYAIDDYHGAIVQGEGNEIYAFTTGYKNQKFDDYIACSKFTFLPEERSLVLNGMYSQNTGAIHTYCTNGIVTYIGNDRFAIITDSRTIEIVEIKETVTLLNSIQLPFNELTKTYASLFRYKDKYILFGENSSHLFIYSYVFNLEELLNVTSITFNTFNFITVYANVSNNIKDANIIPFENYFVLFGGKEESVWYGGIMCLCKVIGNNLSGVDSSNFVTNYNGNSIGFAKTSGASGETIQVYVPKSN